MTLGTWPLDGGIPPRGRAVLAASHSEGGLTGGTVNTSAATSAVFSAVSPITVINTMNGSGLLYVTVSVTMYTSAASLFWLQLWTGDGSAAGEMKTTNVGRAFLNTTADHRIIYGQTLALVGSGSRSFMGQINRQSGSGNIQWDGNDRYCLTAIQVA